MPESTEKLRDASITETTGGGSVLDASAPSPCKTGVPSATVLIDALSFTLHGENPMNDSDWILGFTEDWEAMPYGKRGYKYGERRGDLFRYSGGRDDMGVHVSGMGKACRELEASRVVNEWPPFFQAILLSSGRFSRLDFAMDDFRGYLDIKQIEKDTRAFNFVSQSNQGRFEDGWKNGKDTGMTIYYGNRVSETFIRIYDKAKQMGLEGQHWVRVEIEFKGDMAHRAAQYAAYNNDLVYLEEVLYRNLDFKVPSDTNPQKTRWETAPYWKNFLDVISKKELSTRPEKKVCEDSALWLEKGVAPTLAMVAIAQDWDLERLGLLVQKGIEKMKPHHWAMIREAQMRGKK